VLAFALTGAGVRPGLQSFAEVYGGFLEYLLAHPGTPGQTRHHRVDGALGVHREDPAGVLGFLPGIERVDQIEPAPRHVGVRVGLAVGERGFHQRQALVERKPRRPGMSGQHLVLLDVGVEAEIECGVPAHLIGEHPTAHRQQPDLA